MFSISTRLISNRGYSKGKGKIPICSLLCQHGHFTCHKILCPVLDPQIWKATTHKKCMHLAMYRLIAVKRPGLSRMRECLFHLYCYTLTYNNAGNFWNCERSKFAGLVVAKRLHERAGARKFLYQTNWPLFAGVWGPLNAMCTGKFPILGHEMKTWKYCMKS